MLCLKTSLKTEVLDWQQAPPGSTCLTGCTFEKEAR
jgi:hypothetical protein